MKNNLSTNRKMTMALTYAALIAGSITMIFPFAWMFLTSFKTQAESMAIPPQIFPANWNFDNFTKALESLPFWNLYLNTLLLILFRVICAVVFSSMAGYAFAKLEFPGKNLLFALVLMQMMLPSQIFIIPQYQMLADMGMTNSIFALVFPGLGDILRGQGNNGIVRMLCPEAVEMVALFLEFPAAQICQIIHGVDIVKAVPVNPAEEPAGEPAVQLFPVGWQHVGNPAGNATLLGVLQNQGNHRPSVTVSNGIRVDTAAVEMGEKDGTAMDKGHLLMAPEDQVGKRILTAPGGNAE